MKFVNGILPKMQKTAIYLNLVKSSSYLRTFMMDGFIAIVRDTMMGHSFPNPTV